MDVTADLSAAERTATLTSWRLDARARPLGGLLDLDDAQAHSTGIAVPQWNGLLLRRAPADAGLHDRAAAWFTGRGVPYGVLVPAEVDHEPPGTSFLHDHPVMVRTLDGLPPLPDLAFDEAPAAQDVAAVQAEAFGDPYALDLAFVAPVSGQAWRPAVVLREDGVALATACVVLTGPTAFVYDVAVLPQAQGRGLGRAVTTWCLHRARRGGATAVALNPTDAGHALYAGLGFTDAPPWRIWTP